jgi:hypothetical protein
MRSSQTQSPQSRRQKRRALSAAAAHGGSGSWAQGAKRGGSNAYETHDGPWVLPTRVGGGIEWRRLILHAFGFVDPSGAREDSAYADGQSCDWG